MPPDYGFNWAVIDHPGNMAYRSELFGDPHDVGRVDYVYRISKTEMSAADWAPFANANLRIGDPWNVAVEAYWEGMLEPGPGGLWPRTDIPAGGRLNLGSVTWYDAARYCNWLHNGRVDTREAMEYGAYDLRAVPANPSPDITPPTRLPGATFFIPTDDEWVKAVHFDPNRYGSEQPGYWLYPYSSDSPPVPGPVGVGTTNAGYYPDSDSLLSFRVGAYTYATTPWGLWDASGGHSEWVEDAYAFAVPMRGFEGTAWFTPDGIPRWDHAGDHGTEIANTRRFALGFRVASVPGPGSAAFAAGVVGWIGTRTARRRSP